MFAYIGWYTVALLWIFHMEKKMRKMQCYTEYIQGCTHYKSVYTETRLYIHRWNLYILVYKRIWASARSYMRLWTLYIWVQVLIYAYIRVCDTLQKHAWLSDSNWESHAYCKAALTITPLALIPKCVSYDIWLLNWGSSFSLGAFWLMSDVLCWAASTPAPAMMRGFAKRGFQV